MTENYIPYTVGLPLVSIYLRVDNKQDLVRLRRYDWVKILGDFGGIMAFVVEFIFFILNHFTHIDFMTEIIKNVYLENRDYMEFLKTRTTVLDSKEAVNGGL
jgi:hypothetical protein